MARLSSVEKQIVQRLRHIANRARDLGTKNRPWTKVVKRKLCQLGQSLGFRVCASGIQRSKCEEEWLYDLVWYRYHPRSKFVQEIGLVAECEWSWTFQDIKDDFEKLMVARSPCRLMVFQAGSRKSLDNYCDRLMRVVRKFRGTETGDRYLFVGWDDTAEEFVFRSFVA